jgi:hypothetical protein
MTTANDLVDQAATICALVREYMNDETNLQHRQTVEDLLDEIDQWQVRVAEARASGDLPPSAAMTNWEDEGGSPPAE